jgi:hypothetical protein
MARPWSRFYPLTGIAALMAFTVAASPGTAAAAPNSQSHVLRVGSFHGVAVQFSDIQSAVNAAQPGDWILVAPGDYHTANTEWGVYITTPGIHLRGMERNTTIVDGTSSSASTSCDSAPSAQQFGPVSGGTPSGRNGIEVFEANGVSVENFTVCNFLSNDGGHGGNQIWWNGGDGTGTVNLTTFHGDYLTASSTYYKDSNSGQGKYGIFTSNEKGPGVIDHSYASNMGDSSYYIGACPDCNATLTHAHAENSALGFSGTNAGGHLIIENSEWDHNKTGIVPNSLNNDDAPPPQNGLCPGTTATSCTLIQNNFVHGNNNPQTPKSGIAGAAPIGAGIELSGSQWDTVIHNTVMRQGSWGIVVHDFPDTETPPPVSHCNGGEQLGSVCYFDAFGNRVADNLMIGNGFFGNPTNSDLADATKAHDPSNCFMGNHGPNGGPVTSDPPNIQTAMGTCGVPNQGDTGTLFAELNCAAGGVLVGPSCPPGSKYPQSKTVSMYPIPTHEKSMPNPCAGVPNNPWCQPVGVPAASALSAAWAVPGLAVLSLWWAARRRRGWSPDVR